MKDKSDENMARARVYFKNGNELSMKWLTELKQDYINAHTHYYSNGKPMLKADLAYEVVKAYSLFYLTTLILVGTVAFYNA